MNTPDRPGFYWARKINRPAEWVMVEVYTVYGGSLDGVEVGTHSAQTVGLRYFSDFVPVHSPASPHGKT